jgi:hypothetical protein
VVLKRLKNKATQEWWAVHVEAWQRSGLSQRRYCMEHRLTVKTFARWLRVLADMEALKIKRELERERRAERRRRKSVPMATQVRSQALRAFWAMHIEAQRWSGIPLEAYARALRLPRYSMRKWRDVFEDGEADEDWRALLHPSARAVLSTSAKASAKGPTAESSLTNTSAAVVEAPEKPNRRSFTPEEKLAIVLETERPGETVSAVARRHDIVTSVLFRWRAELGFGRDKRAKLGTVKLAASKPGSGSVPLVLHDLIPPPDGMFAVELDDGRRVFAPIGSDPHAVRAQVARQETAPC